MIKKEIEGRHVLIVGAGASTKKYWDKIKVFMEENDVITFGCNHVSNILIPDYHFWNSVMRWEKFGSLLSYKSNLYFSEHFSIELIRKYWKGKLKRYKHTKRYWEYESDKNNKQKKRCLVTYKNKTMYGCFNIGSLAIFHAYIKKASKISVVGLDGYTFLSKKDLENNRKSQHCYGKGFTDGQTYEYGRKKDIDAYRTLSLLSKYCKKRYGFKFKILTPTVYEKFYDPKILEIKEKYQGNSPSIKEYSHLRKYFKNKKIK